MIASALVNTNRFNRVGHMKSYEYANAQVKFKKERLLKLLALSENVTDLFAHRLPFSKKICEMLKF